jgi:hypothetical protein
MEDKEENSSSLIDELEFFNNFINAKKKIPKFDSDEKDKNNIREISYILPKGGQTGDVEMENVGNLCDDKLKNFNKKENENENNETHIINNTKKYNDTSEVMLSLSESNSQDNNSFEENRFAKTYKNKFQENKIYQIVMFEGKVCLYDINEGILIEYNQKEEDKIYTIFGNNNQSKEYDDDLSQILYFMNTILVPFNFYIFQQKPNNNINSKEIHQFLSLKIIVKKYGKYFKKLYPKIFENKDELVNMRKSIICIKIVNYLKGITNEEIEDKNKANEKIEDKANEKKNNKQKKKIIE